MLFYWEDEEDYVVTVFGSFSYLNGNNQTIINFEGKLSETDCQCDP